MAGIGLLGCGTVGSGVRELLEKNASQVRLRAGEPLTVRRILEKWQRFGREPGLFTDDFDEILGDPSITLVAECMGGLQPAFRYVKAALDSGRSVATSNKELVAEKGDVLLRAARARNVNFFFEASVGGGIPLIKPLYACIGPSEVRELCGILNGTTNYILTQMAEKGKTFGAALFEAQQEGCAEQDPSADVDGLDAARKIAILASLCFGSRVAPGDVSTCGIRSVTPEQLAEAAARGGAVKLIARAGQDAEGRVACSVGPMFVPGAHPLARVDGVYNGVVVDTRFAGRLLFCGQGAGRYPTAAAVVSDLIDAARAGGSVPGLFWKRRSAARIAPPAPWDLSGGLPELAL